MKRGEELMRCRASVGEVEMVRWRINSASSERGRVATGGLRCGDGSSKPRKEKAASGLAWARVGRADRAVDGLA
jgi:hypothetical protein